MRVNPSTAVPAGSSASPGEVPGVPFSPSSGSRAIALEPIPAAPEGGGPSLSDKSNNSTESESHTPSGRPGSVSYLAKSAAVLHTNTAAFCSRVGIERVGFLTLTFADHVLCPREAQKRFNSLATHVLRPRYGSYIRVLERQKSGRIHYHLLVACPDDIRTGADFAAFGEGDYRSASRALRGEWRFWRETAREYGFGRTELLPVRTCSEAVASYVGKYIGKHFRVREPRDKRVRLVSYSGERVANVRFSWASDPKRRRLRRGALVRALHAAGHISSPTPEAMRSRYGKRWVWEWADVINHFPLPDELESGEGSAERPAEAPQGRRLSAARPSPATSGSASLPSSPEARELREWARVLRGEPGVEPKANPRGSDLAAPS